MAKVLWKVVDQRARCLYPFYFRYILITKQSKRITVIYSSQITSSLSIQHEATVLTSSRTCDTPRNPPRTIRWWWVRNHSNQRHCLTKDRGCSRTTKSTPTWYRMLVKEYNKPLLIPSLLAANYVCTFVNTGASRVVGKPHHLGLFTAQTPNEPADSGVRITTLHLRTCNLTTVACSRWSPVTN